MIQGRIAGMAAAERSGYLEEDEMSALFLEANSSLSQLRQGMFSHVNKGRTDLTETDEGYRLSASLLSRGYVEDSEIQGIPLRCFPPPGVHPVIECTQNIPCNPCQDACRFGCIRVGETITSLPQIRGGYKMWDAECVCKLFRAGNFPGR